ncbi:MAG: DUF202 domain-containing protein [Candidatus Sumerlaeota bacterium]
MDNKNPADTDALRTRMAGERTLLAWVRTGLAMMGFGFVIARFGFYLREMSVLEGKELPAGKGLSLWVGAIMIMMGVVVNLVAAIEHRKFLRVIEQGGAYIPPRWSLSMMLAMALAVLGLFMTAYLFILGY